MTKVFDTAALAAMSIEQLEQQAAMPEGGEQDEVIEETGEQVVEEGVSTDAADESPQAETFVETKDGKGRIPFKVLAETREELKSLRKQLEGRSYVANVPADYQEQVASVSADIAQLGKQFEEGDITWEEYQVKQSEVTQKREALLAASIKAEISSEMRQQQSVDTWQDTVNHFIENPNPDDGIDYRTEPDKLATLDTLVKALASDPANNDKDQRWFLETAHAVVKTMAGISVANKLEPDTKAPVSKKAVPTSGVKPSINSLSDIPGGLPPARSEMEQFGELSGAVIGQRFAKLTSAQIDQQLSDMGLM